MNRRWNLSPALIAALLASCGGDDNPGAERCTPAPGTICTIIGTGTAGHQGDEGPANEAELYLPMDMEWSPDGLLYVVDWNNHQLRVVDKDNVIHRFAGTGRLGDGPPGPALESAFNHPTDIIFDDEGRLLIAAWHNSKIKRIDVDTGIIEDISGSGARTYTGDGGPALMANLDLPNSLAFDKDKNLYVLDQANQMVRRIDTDGNIERFAGQCIIDTPTDPCGEDEVPEACPSPSLRLTCNLDTDPMCARPCRGAFAGDGGDRLEARFSQPVGQAADPAGRIAFDADGNLYVADTQNNRIRRIDADGKVTTFAGTGKEGHKGDGGPADEAELARPVDVEVGKDGTVYIADTENSCVRAVPTKGADKGMIRTVAGVCGEQGFDGDGAAPDAALLNRPYGITVTEDGTLYIADTHNHRVRVVTPAE